MQDSVYELVEAEPVGEKETKSLAAMSSVELGKWLEDNKFSPQAIKRLSPFNGDQLSRLPEDKLKVILSHFFFLLTKKYIVPSRSGMCQVFKIVRKARW